MNPELREIFLPTLNRQRVYPHQLDLTRMSPIPKVIHQVYFSNKPLPAELAENSIRLKNLNPDWDYRLFDDRDMERFVWDNYGNDVREAYKLINPTYGAALADFFRYLLMFKKGGVYLDIKSSATRPFNEVLHPDDMFLISQWKNERSDRFAGWGLHDEISTVPGGEYQQWYIACAPNHPFLKAVIENIIRNIHVYNRGLHGTGQYGVLRVTGPIAYTLAIAPLLDRYPHRFADSHDDLGLIYSIYEDERHLKLFKDHYSELHDPIIRPTLRKRVTSVGYEAARHLRRIFLLKG